MQMIDRIKDEMRGNCYIETLLGQVDQGVITEVRDEQNGRGFIGDCKK